MSDSILPVILIVVVICAVVAILVISNGPGCDKVKCLQTVTSTYPNDSVYLVPDSSYTFMVVKKNGDVFLVKTMNSRNTDITSTAPLVKASIAVSTEPTHVEK